MGSLKSDSFHFSTGTKSTSEGDTYPSSIGQNDQDENQSQISDLGKREFMPWEFELSEYTGIGLPQQKKAALNRDFFGEMNNEDELSYADNDIQFQFNMEQDFTSF